MCQSDGPRGPQLWLTAETLSSTGRGGEGAPWVSVQEMDGASLLDRGGKEDGGATFRMGCFVHGAAQLPPHPFLLLPLPHG